MNLLENCGRCHYFERTTPEGMQPLQGLCCRHAPAAILYGTQEVNMPGLPQPVKQPLICGAWPVVNGPQWCGEFKECARIQVATAIAGPTRQ